jgi:tetratricopeptide (TPR) repeat protein/uncharacterized membrane protein YhaH (DUF805 family)
MAWLAFLFFNFRGRIGRASWWIGEAILLCIGLLAQTYSRGWDFWRLSEATTIQPPTLAETALSLVLLVPALALTIKRLNDRDHAPWLGYLFAISCFALIVAQYFGFPSFESKEIRLSQLLLIMPFGIFGLWVVIDNGFLRGTRGPNRYGPDPLSSSATHSASTTPPPSGYRRSFGTYVRDGLTVSICAAFALAATSHFGLTDLPDRMVRKLLYPRNLTVLQERRENKAAYQAHYDGLAAMKADDNQTAIRLFSRAIELYGPDKDTAAESYLFRGNVLRDVGRLEDALQDYEKIVAIQPEGWAYSSRAYAYRQLGRYADALKDYDVAIASDPDSASDHNGRALTLQKLGRTQEALAAYGEALRAASRSFERSMKDLENDKYRKDQTAVWLSRYEKSRNRDTTTARAGRGNVLRDLGRLDEALTEYTEALQIRADDYFVYVNRGWLYEKQGNRVAARGDYEKAASLKDPDEWLRRALERVQQSTP